MAEALEKSHISGPGVADIFIELLDKKFEEMGFYDGKPNSTPNFFDAPRNWNASSSRADECSGRIAACEF